MIQDKDLDEMIGAVRQTDPLLGEHDNVVTDAHLATSALLLRQRRAAGPEVSDLRFPERWLKRVLTVAAGVAVLTVLTPTLSGWFGASRDPLVGTAVASTAGLTCGSGYAQAIPPSSASRRPWPNQVPDGWRASAVFARSTDVTGWCTTPSLVVTRTAADGLVTGTVKITGPAQGIRIDGPAPAEERIGPWRAQYLSSFSASYNAWLVTDGSGRQWYAAVDGWSKQQAATLLGAAGFQGDAVTWDQQRAPGLAVLHQRTGHPYPVRDTGEDWYVRFTDSEGRERTLEARSGRDGESAVSDTTVGDRIITAEGTRMRVFGAKKPVSVYADMGDGTVLFSEVHGNLDAVLGTLASTTNLPRTDERLKQYALKESYDDERR